MAKRKQDDEGERKKQEDEELRALYAQYKKSFTAADLQKYTVMEKGIPAEKAKEIVKFIKGTGIRVQAAIQENQVRVSGKNRDDLQAVIGSLKGQDFGLDLQFTNYRSS